MAQIHELIGKAIGMIGAIGKDNKNAQQGFEYRSIDQVYNALNPVMAELGIFFTPEIIDQRRDERVNKNGTVLTYTLLTIRYTAYAPDGSNVSMTVVGEGMDSGDKGSNKAMSIAYKYALFQLFCIPTEELRDPDADVYKDILPKNDLPPVGEIKAPKADVATANKMPELSDEMKYLNDELGRLANEQKTTMASMKSSFAVAKKALVKMSRVPDKDVKEYTKDELNAVLDFMQENMS